MALVFEGMTCAICRRSIAAGDRYVATTHFAKDKSDPFYGYSDIGMHESCFDAWEQRAEFRSHYRQVMGREHSGEASTMESRVVARERVRAEIENMKRSGTLPDLTPLPDLSRRPDATRTTARAGVILVLLIIAVAGMCYTGWMLYTLPAAPAK